MAMCGFDGEDETPNCTLVELKLSKFRYLPYTHLAPNCTLVELK